MDGLAGYGSEDSENSSKSPRTKTMNKHQKSTDAEPQSEKSSAQLEAEWESFQAMISTDIAPAAPVAPAKAKDDCSSSESDSEDEKEKKKKRRGSTSSSGSSDKSDKSGSDSGSSDESSDNDSGDEKKKKKQKEAGSIKVKQGSRSPQAPSAKRKSRSPSSSSESETEKKPAPSLTAAGQPNGTPHTDSVPKERRSSRQSLSPKRRRSKSRSKSPNKRRSSRDHRSRSRERKRRRRPRRSRSRGRRSRSRDRRPRRRSRSREKGPHDKQDDKTRSQSRSLTRRKRSRSRSPRRRHRPRSGSRSRRRPRSRSGSPHRVLRRRRRRRRRRKRRPSGRVSRSRSRSRSPAPVKKKRNEPLNYKEKLKQSLLQVQKQAAEGKLNMDELTSNTKDLISPSEKPSNLPLGSNNPLVAMATGQLSHVTPQQALLQTMAAMHQKAQELTGVAVPKYYNPASVNPLKYAEQVQKRKLLWGKNKKVEAKAETTEETSKPATTTKTQWDGQLFQQDQDGKQTAKFRKLMGMKVGETSGEGSGAAATSESAGSEDTSMIKKHQEVFSRLDQEYEFARMATHTHRGIGLGFTSMHHQYSSNK